LTAYGAGRLAVVMSSNKGKFDVVGVDSKTGEIAWFFQHIPG